MNFNKSSAILRKAVRIACVQFASGPHKAANIDNARSQVAKAASEGAGIVILPECFNSPYSTSEFKDYAEVLHPSPPPEDESPTYHALSNMAREASVYLIGGSVPELEAGNKITIIDLEDYGKIGLGICFDIRFPEPAAIAARSGAFFLIYPSAFNRTTGSLHWELLSRSRALDNQVYVAMCSQSFEPGSSYPAWGYSMVVDPSGQIVTSATRNEAIVYADLTEETIYNCRKQVPLETSRRFDIYPDVSTQT
ncbi:carbon-nitrogen hydrolase [Fusarium avenaceum]|nr:carbon-nitrogen hydrolase [Fusarium avenaceum]